MIKAVCANLILDSFQLTEEQLNVGVCFMVRVLKKKTFPFSIPSWDCKISSMHHIWWHECGLYEQTTEEVAYKILK